jgi:hypothetical protein
VRIVDGDSEIVRVLDRETCSLKLETPFSKPVSDLKIEECSARAEDRLSEPERFLANPFI